MKQDRENPHSATGESHARIAGDHEVLKESLRRLEETTDLRQLVQMLDELRAHLEAHFVREEAPEGFHEMIGDSAPHLLAYLQRLFEEHQEFLQDIERLSEKARKVFEGPVNEVLCEVGSLCRRLQLHESREAALLGEAMYTDLGESS